MVCNCNKRLLRVWNCLDTLQLFWNNQKRTWFVLYWPKFLIKNRFCLNVFTICKSGHLLKQQDGACPRRRHRPESLPRGCQRPPEIAVSIKRELMSWSHDVMMSWSHDVIKSWCHDVLKSWFHEVMMSWCHEVMSGNSAGCQQGKADCYSNPWASLVCFRSRKNIVGLKKLPWDSVTIFFLLLFLLFLLVIKSKEYFFFNKMIKPKGF